MKSLVEEVEVTIEHTEEAEKVKERERERERERDFLCLSLFEFTDFYSLATFLS